MKYMTRTFLVGMMGGIVASLLIDTCTAHAQQRVDHHTYPAGYFDHVNIGDNVDGRAGYKWLHDGTGWVIVDCYAAIYDGPLSYKKLCALDTPPEPNRTPANGYPVWEVGATYYKAYPSERFMLLGIIISPISNKRVLALQKLSEPFGFETFQEDKQLAPFIRVQ